ELWPVTFAGHARRARIAGQSSPGFGRVGSGVGDLAATLAAVEVVAPGRLHGERPGAQGDVLRGPLARGDPRALVGILRALDVGPATGGELVGDRLGVFVPVDDGHAVDRTGSATVDEVGAAAAAGV